jgi:hypothetical protein
MYPPQGAGAGITWSDVKIKLEDSTETKNIVGDIVAQKKTFTTGRTWTVPAGHVWSFILPPSAYISGTDTIQGDGEIIGFEL